MRLTDAQHQKILEVCAQIFLGQEHRVYLFGSRVDEQARGGDVDLLIMTNKGTIEQELGWKEALKESIEQEIQLPVDIVIQNENRPLKRVSHIATQEGIRL